MEKMKRNMSVVCAALFLLLMVMSFCSFCAAEAELPLVEYYYENYCGSCQPDRDFIDEFAELTGEALSNYRYLSYNVATDHGMASLKEAAERYNIEEVPRIPLVVVDGRVFMGSTMIHTDLPAYGIERAESTQSIIYYLYVDGCADCAKAKEFVDALPESITVKRGDFEFESEVVVHRINIALQSALAGALFDAYKVPEDKRYAPMLLAGQAYYDDSTRIERFLKGPLYRANAVNSIVVADDLAGE